MAEEEDTSWLDGPARGENMPKLRMSQILGVARMTLEKMIKDGCPVVARGSRKGQEWILNTADVIEWREKRAVELATGNPNTASFDVAKRQDKEESVRARRIANATKLRQLIEVDEVVEFIGRTLGVVRSRFLAVESQVSGLTPDQREQLKTAIVDAFADVSGDKKSDWKAEDDDADEFDASEIDTDGDSEA